VAPAVPSGVTPVTVHANAGTMQAPPSDQAVGPTAGATLLPGMAHVLALTAPSLGVELNLTLPPPPHPPAGSGPSLTCRSGTGCRCTRARPQSSCCQSQ
jgi:hypothetical protein